MPEENRNVPTLETIVGEMKNVADLTRVLHTYDDAKEPSEYADLLNRAVQILSKAKPGQPNYNNTLAELEADRGSAYLKIQGSKDLRIGTISETYEAHKDEIITSIIDKLDGNLKGAKDKVDAIRKVTYAFLPVFAPLLPKITQEQANRRATQELMKVTQMPIMTKQATGDPELMKDLAYRSLVNDLLVETEEDGAKHYSINREKLAELADDVGIGSMLYTAQPPKEKR